MATSFLKHTKKRFLQMGLGAVCVFLAVDNFLEIIITVALLISVFYLNLQTVKRSFTNKANMTVANLTKAFKPIYLGGFFYFGNLITC